MEFALTKYQNYSLLEISGRIDSYTAPKIDNVLHALISENHGNILIDLEKVSYISSSGILIFVNAQKSLTRKNRGKIHFSGTSKGPG